MSGPDRIWILPTHKASKPDDFYLLHPDYRNGRGAEYIRRDPAVLAALPEVQALIAAAEARALDSVTTLHTVIADIRAATVGGKPMLSELAQALVAWRDEAVVKEREACAAEAEDHGIPGMYQAMPLPFLAGYADACQGIAAAIRKRGEG